MVTVIIVGIVILSLVLLGWTWVSLGNIEKQKKILYIICGIFITWIITFIIYIKNFFIINSISLSNN